MFYRPCSKGGVILKEHSRPAVQSCSCFCTISRKLHRGIPSFAITMTSLITGSMHICNHTTCLTCLLPMWATSQRCPNQNPVIAPVSPKKHGLPLQHQCDTAIHATHAIHTLQDPRAWGSTRSATAGLCRRRCSPLPTRAEAADLAAQGCKARGTGMACCKIPPLVHATKVAFA